MALIVYGANLSPFVRKVRVALAEKGLAYSLEPVTPFSPPPDFAEISPLKRIPAFRDTDLPEPNNHLADSSVVCDYLEHKYPTPPLYPRDPAGGFHPRWPSSDYREPSGFHPGRLSPFPGGPNQKFGPTENFVQGTHRDTLSSRALATIPVTNPV